MIPELIGAGASLLGGLLGGGDKQTESYVDYKRMVREAERAGFNPLTAIRNGGSAGFTNTIHPALGSGAFIADALGQVGTAIASYDPMAEARAKLEDDIRRATLANIQADTQARLRTSIGGVPVSTGGRFERRASGNAAQLSVGGPIEPGGRTVTNPWRDGEVHPEYLDAETFEARYGDSELAQTAFGARNMAADLVYNLERWSKSDYPLGRITKVPDEEKTWWPSLSIKWR